MSVDLSDLLGSLGSVAFGRCFSGRVKSVGDVRDRGGFIPTSPVR